MRQSICGLSSEAATRSPETFVIISLTSFSIIVSDDPQKSTSPLCSGSKPCVCSFPTLFLSFLLRSSSSLALSSRTSFMETWIRVSGRSSSLSRSFNLLACYSDRKKSALDVQFRRVVTRSRRGPGTDRRVLRRIGFRNISSLRCLVGPGLLFKKIVRDDARKNVAGELEHTELIPTS